MNDYQSQLCEEYLRALINEEAAAINSYMQKASVLEKDYPKAAFILRDIAKEERAHIGELQTLYSVTFPEYQQDVEEGNAEILEKLNGMPVEEGCCCEEEGPVQEF